MKLSERQFSPEASIVFVGKDHCGHWGARDQNGMFGGLFVNGAQALKYALLESGNHPRMIVEVSCPLELEPPVDRELSADASPDAELMRSSAAFCYASTKSG
ncbi:hypothetical protein [Bradyrhizobium sp. BR 1432]|uniref:hypothetical protein n=1 Tax=Bradyrhizobium sp. BR 1432 TaxID=3447966 RepID=UPI003EE6D39A